MDVRFERSFAVGDFSAPPSKSFCHRALICSALSHGESTVYGVQPSDDICATIDCLRNMGARVTVSGDTAHIIGCDFDADSSGVTLDCRQSGTTLRFMTAIALLCDRQITLTGSPRLMERTMSAYEELCAANGYSFRHDERGITVDGHLKCGGYRISADVSSQFVSGLLLALGYLDGESNVVISGNAVSRPYIEMTRRVMRDFGVDTEYRGDMITVRGGAYSGCEYHVEGDCSNAAYFDAMNRLGSEIKIIGLDSDTVQGDGAFSVLFDELDEGCATVDVTDCPDLAPILMAYGACRHGVTLTGTARLAEKESDRGREMATELRKFGVGVTCLDDSVIVMPAEIIRPTENIVSHGDHRIVMACSVLLMLTGGVLIGADDVNKSFPGFFDVLRRLGVDVK
ncbi:MAG: 3-phosphoshikimate 1-carboxyvinyltransferase [Clostridia bacterium]|nr:3-phosphoshikimate 1-carboxyvinyltransferase [Clostridia bacterium]